MIVTNKRYIEIQDAEVRKYAYDQGTEVSRDFQLWLTNVGMPMADMDTATKGYADTIDLFSDLSP